MLGIVLCGGKSSRMGSDKGLLKTEVKTWAQIATDKLAKLHITVMISVNSDQFPAYASLFSSVDLIVDDASLLVKGPLLGVLSCHVRYPAEDLFILACDLPLVDISLLHELISAYDQQPSHGAFVFTKDGEPEPLCGIYTSKCLSFILSLLQSGKLAKHSMKNMLDHVSATRISLSDDQKKSFTNFNSQSALNGL